MDREVALLAEMDKVKAEASEYMCFLLILLILMHWKQGFSLDQLLDLEQGCSCALEILRWITLKLLQIARHALSKVAIDFGMFHLHLATFMT